MSTTKFLILALLLVNVGNSMSYANCGDNLNYNQSELNKIKEFSHSLKEFSSKLPGTLSVSSESKFPALLDIIKDGFNTWIEAGMNFTPSRQNLQETISHANRDRGILYHDGTTFVATYSYEPLKIKNSLEGKLSVESSAWKTEYIKNSMWIDKYYTDDAILFRKFSVRQSHQNSGIGRLMMDDFVLRCKYLRYDSIYIESSPQAPWLYQWYLNMGFEVIGTNSPSDRGVTTLLLRLDLEN